NVSCRRVAWIRIPFRRFAFIGVVFSVMRMCLHAAMRCSSVFTARKTLMGCYLGEKEGKGVHVKSATAYIT
ncbi:hypothetical protein BDQ17DRAFT_1369690, partial [Cyathus striatus]